MLLRKGRAEPQPPPPLMTATTPVLSTHAAVGFCIGTEAERVRGRFRRGG